MNREILVLRETVVKLTQLLTGMGLTVTQQGSSAYVETDKVTGKPKRINIPHIPDNATRELILAIQGFVDHEVAHVLFTDFAVFQKVLKLRDAHLKGLFNILEDTFIERRMMQKFPGSVYNMKQLHTFFVSDLTKPALEKVAGDPVQEFGVLLPPLIRAVAGQDVFKDFMKGHMDHPVVKLLMDKLTDAMRKRIASIPNSAEAFKIAQEILEIMRPPEESSSEGGEGEGAGRGKAPPNAKPKKDEGEKDESEGEASKPKKGGKAPADDKKKDEPGDAESGEDEEEDADGEDESEKDGKPSDGKDGEDDTGDEKDEGGADDEDDDADENEGDESGSGEDDGEDEESSDAGEDEGEDEGDSGSVGSSGADDDGSDDGDASTGDDDGEVTDGTLKQPDRDSDAPEEGKNSFGDIDIPEPMDYEEELSKHVAEETRRATTASEYSLFSRDFDTFEPMKVDAARYQDHWLTGLEDRTRSMVGLMQKDIERMMAARSLSVKVPGYRSGRLHSSGLHRLMAGDDRIFRRKHEAETKDTVVGLLVDCSGSMRSQNKIGIAMAAAYALSQTLERVSVPHEVTGFTTHGLHSRPGYNMDVIRAESLKIGRDYSRVEPLNHIIFKSFSERLTPETKRRFASGEYLLPLANNVDGEAVEDAYRRLLPRSEKRRVLLVLSDGHPACYGDMDEQEYKLRQAVGDAQKAGVEVIGIGILDHSVRRFYPRSVVLSDLASLPKTVMGEIKRLLTAA